MKGLEAADRRNGARTSWSRRPRRRPSGRFERCRRTPSRLRSGSIRETAERVVPEQPVRPVPIPSRAFMSGSPATRGIAPEREFFCKVFEVFVFIVPFTGSGNPLRC